MIAILNGAFEPRAADIARALAAALGGAHLGRGEPLPAVRPLVILGHHEGCADLRSHRLELSAHDDEIYAFALLPAGQDHAVHDRESRRGDFGFPVVVSSAAAAAAWIHADIRAPVEQVPHDPGWAGLFRREERLLRRTLGARALEVHHVGSTCLPGAPAKPIIDILLVVESIDAGRGCAGEMLDAGYRLVDYPQNTDKLFFRKGLPRSHHVHMAPRGAAGCRAQLAFRDALLADAALLAEYVAIKQSALGRFREDRAAFGAAKAAFIQRVLSEKLDRG